jgi:hypothetical protein
VELPGLILAPGGRSGYSPDVGQYRCHHAPRRAGLAARAPVPACDDESPRRHVGVRQRERPACRGQHTPAPRLTSPPSFALTSPSHEPAPDNQSWSQSWLSEPSASSPRPRHVWNLFRQTTTTVQCALVIAVRSRSCGTRVRLCSARAAQSVQFTTCAMSGVVRRPDAAFRHAGPRCRPGHLECPAVEALRELLFSGWCADRRRGCASPTSPGRDLPGSRS